MVVVGAVREVERGRWCGVVNEGLRAVNQDTRSSGLREEANNLSDRMGLRPPVPNLRVRAVSLLGFLKNPRRRSVLFG